MKDRVEYFAYGSNLSQLQMKERDISIKKSIQAELPGWKLAFTIYSETWRGGVADILPEPDKRVKGVVYTIEKEDLESLDHYEGRLVENNMERGMYRRQYMPVKTEKGWKTVLTYVVNKAIEHKKKIDLKPSREYLDTIVSGALEHSIDGEYVKKLKAIDTKEKRREGDYRDI